MIHPLRWGILGTGRVAHLFAKGLEATKSGVITAVGSRSESTATEFASVFSIPFAHSSYVDLCQNPNVDIVYVASPHTLHSENVLLSLNSNKHVLCEKPFALNVKQAKDMIDCARRNKRFLMEAMWTQFIPSLLKLKELLAANIIGGVTRVNASCGFRADKNHGRRMFDPLLGGGALLDMGIYNVSLANYFFGQPSEIHANAKFGDTNVDEATNVTLKYSCGGLATLSCSIVEDCSNEFMIEGECGTITLAAPWWHGQKLMVKRDNETPYIIDAPLVGNGYNYEAEEVVRCIFNGIYESQIMPWSKTLRDMHTLDEIRKIINLKYPHE